MKAFWEEISRTKADDLQKILEILLKDGFTPTELAATLRISPPSTCNRLKILCEENLIKGTKRGREMIYNLTEEGYKEIQELLVNSNSVKNEFEVKHKIETNLMEMETDFLKNILENLPPHPYINLLLYDFSQTMETFSVDEIKYLLYFLEIFTPQNGLNAREYIAQYIENESEYIRNLLNKLLLFSLEIQKQHLSKFLNNSF